MCVVHEVGPSCLMFNCSRKLRCFGVASGVLIYSACECISTSTVTFCSRLQRRYHQTNSANSGPSSAPHAAWPSHPKLPMPAAATCHQL